MFNKNKKYIIITVIFLSISFIFGGITLSKNYKDIIKSSISAFKNEDSSFINRFFSSIEQAIATSNSLYNKNIAFQDIFIEGYGASQKMLDKKLIDDANVGYILKDEQDMLHFPAYNVDTTLTAKKLVEMNNYLKSINIPFSFILALPKDSESTTFKNGIDVYANSKSNGDKFIKELEDNNINSLDLRSSKNIDTLDFKNAFFKTDHHWKTETAFWAYREIVNYINDTHNINLDKNNFYTDINNYNLETLDNSFLGSLGKRMGRIYSAVDDYTLITPNFDTNIKLYKGINKTFVSEGSFDETIVDKNLANIENPITTNRYASYFSLDNDFQTVINENAPNDYKILIIKDSYALPVSAFLSLTCKEVSMVDFRLSKNQSVKDFINNSDYDLVLMLYGYGSICTESMFELK